MTQHKKAMKDWLSATARTNLYSPVLSKKIKKTRIILHVWKLGKHNKSDVITWDFGKDTKETIRETEAPSVLNR